MQPAPPAPPQDPYRWVWLLLAAVVLAFGAFAFVQTRDPMIFLFGAIAFAIVAAVLRPTRWYGWGAWHGPPSMGPPREVVKVRCASCRALNDENARFCQQCGKPIA